MGMIDIAHKKPTLREAIVEGKVYMKPAVIARIKKRKIPKGDVLETAKIAGIAASKRAPFLIPLCHPILIEHAAIDFSVKSRYIGITAHVKGEAKTGVEMEAFTALAISALTIYDMCKSLDREASIGDIRLVKKSGGKSETGKNTGSIDF